MANTYDLNLLTALDALLATGSVTAAAARMHLSTPAMSHTLARIREAFGDPILVRAGRKLVPTPRALALVEPVRALLAQAQALRAPLDAQDLAAVDRRFVVRAPEGIAVVFGASLSRALESDMPLATLQFLPETLADPGGLREGRLDLDIGSFRSTDPETETQVLSQQRLVGAVRTGHPLMKLPKKNPLSAQRFAAARHVGVTPRAGEVSAVDLALEALGLERQVALLVPSSFSALIAASRTDLVASVPERTARGMAASLGLQVFDLPVLVPAEAMRMAWHPRHGADPAHRWLRERMQRVLDEPRWIVPSVASLATGARKGVV
ncbi:LysR family transcriptional regulator [Variovorax saccharolyticus]|uniref:LysR family transcriptional regulator n=1 Tax=Variovorax saccharolyticus TaxID=3053516 RepID=UPI002574D41D|nr:LysR family transcriptional regulator [Variovorax sp. J31P216]MDM0029483.1 LysR family transcriptional regulator [Variovorax sp. J31P216]